MGMENYRLLAGLIAAHRDGKVVGRTRLQKEVKLLQRLGFPTDYSYTIHFYGPYSEDLQADIGLLDAFGMATEELKVAQDGTPYYVLRATQMDVPSEVSGFQGIIDLLDAKPSVVLELAATYDTFREMGSGHGDALQRLRRKKGAKCDEGREEQAVELLKKLGLPKEEAPL